MGAGLRPELSTVAGRYRLEDRLGRGGMADVLVAHDTVLDRRVAIKLLRDGPDSEAARARFVTEARILAALSHPGLVTVLDAGINDEQPYLVMELVPGGTAADLLDRGAQPVDRVAELGSQVAAALVAVHAGGVVHRDVKPGNILIDGWGRARLADFGIARLVADNVRATATGMTIGTMAYLAPEQASGGEITTAVDLYALGLVLLELLTGAPAFTGTPTEAALARLTRDPAVPDHLPRALHAVLTEMTAREPGDRPTAAEAAERLASLGRVAAASRAAQADLDTVAAIPVVRAPAAAPGTWWSRRRARAGALAATVAVAGMLAGGFLIGGAPADDVASRAGRSTSPSASAASGGEPSAAGARAAAPAEPAVSTTASAQPVHERSTARHHRAKHHKQRHHHKAHHARPHHHKPHHAKPHHAKPHHHKPKHHH